MTTDNIPKKTTEVFFPSKKQIEYKENDLPEINDEQILVENEISLVSAGTELAMYTETHIGFSDPNDHHAEYPVYPGYNAIGTVRAVGKNITGTKVGDRVMHMGKHAPWGIVDMCGLGVLPEEIPSEHALFIAMAQISIAAIRKTAIHVGSDAVVLGMGMVGNLCAQLLLNAGCRRVIGVDLAAERLKLAKECDIDHVVNPADGSVDEQVEKILGKAPAIAIEAIGLNQTILQALDIVGQHGQVLLLGSPRKPLEIDIYHKIHRKNVSLIGAHAWFGMENTDESYAYIQELIISGRMKVEPLISQHLKFENLQEAYTGLLEKPDEYMGVVIEY